MNWLFFILIGFASGVFAGMGMGGGTFLIPLLTIFMEVGQTQAQGTNLIVFVPMAIIVGLIYSKSKLIDWNKAWIVAASAIAVTIPAAFFAVDISGKILKIIFGVFIILIGAGQLVFVIVKRIRANQKQ